MRSLFLFEDNPNSPSSVLLKNCIKGRDIYFSKGNVFLLNWIEYLCKDNDCFLYVFMDVPPNREDLISYYHYVRQTINRSKHKSNVMLIPIVCIEYYLSKYLYKYGYLDKLKGPLASDMLNYLVKDFDYSKIDFSKVKSDNTRNSITESLEKLYKYVMNSHVKRCLVNSFKYKGSNTVNRDMNCLDGIFYDRDCACDERYCKICCRDSLAKKAELFYCSLPVFIISDNEHRNTIDNYNVEYTEISNNDLYKRVKDLYNKLCDSMGVPKIKLFN